MWMYMIRALLCFLIVVGGITGLVHAEGYRTEREAVQMFEADYQKHVELPAWFPFEILEREAKVYDKKLEIDYHGKQARDTMILFVEPHAEKIKPYAVDQSIELVDGTTAYFRVKHPGFFQLDVQKEGLLYRIWVGTNSTKRISTSTMKDIADSMKKKSQLPA